MESTHFSSMNKEPTKTRASTRQIHAFSSKTYTAARSKNPCKSKTVSPKNENQFQAQNFVILTSGQHVNEVNQNEALAQKDPGRERLKRRGEEVADRVIIPETWGQENLLKSWIDYSSFDRLLAPSGIDSAREALIAEGRRASSQRLRLESRC